MELIMNSDQVLDLIDSVAATSGKNDKISMLKAVSGSNLLRAVLEATYNPIVSYGIRQFPDRAVDATGDAHFSAPTWGVIAALRERQVTGNAAQAAIQHEMNTLSVKSAELFKRIILKDMRAGFSEETVNKVWGGLLPEFPYQRCCLPKDAKLDTWNWAEGHISQQKADGMFANVNHEEGGQVFIFSRQGSMFPMEKFEELATVVKLSLAAGTQNHGELLVMRDGAILAREIGNGVLNSVLKGGDFAENERPIFMVWDQIPLDAVKPKGKYAVPYVQRLKGLIEQLRGGANINVVQLIPTKIVKSLTEAYQHAAEVMLAGGEGTILKNRNAHWKDGTSKEQVKLKLEFTVDLEVQGVVLGRDNTKNAGRAGSLKCATSDGKLEVDVAIKGEKMRDAVDANPDDWIGRIMPVTANLVLKPSESNELHSLFLPRFAESEYRTDKTVADSLQRVFDQEEAAKLGVAIKDGTALKAAA